MMALVGVELSVDEDSIPAGGRKVIRVKMRPCVRGRHTLTVIYQLNLPSKTTIT